MWNKKQKRAYHRIQTGVRVAQLKQQKIKHLILTTSPQCRNHNICSDFQTLRKRIYRKFNYLLSYAMVHTNEGNGVLHVLYSGPYLPQQWLSNQWDDIHKSPYVYIKEPPKDVSRYITTQYIANQQTSFQRCSWSQNWVCKGFVSQWKHYCRWFNEWKISLNLTITDLLNKWDRWLQNQVFKQTELPI